MYNLPCYLLQFTFCSISQPKPWTIKLITPRLSAAECQALDWGQVAHSGMEGDSNLHFSPASWQWMIATFQSCWSWKEFLHNAISLFIQVKADLHREFVEPNVPSWQQSLWLSHFTWCLIIANHILLAKCQSAQEQQINHNEGFILVLKVFDGCCVLYQWNVQHHSSTQHLTITNGVLC